MRITNAYQQCRPKTVAIALAKSLPSTVSISLHATGAVYRYTPTLTLAHTPMHTDVHTYCHSILILFSFCAYINTRMQMQS